MENYEIIGWPDIQAFMDLEGFEESTTLIEPNDSMGIGSSTYLVSKEWLDSLEVEGILSYSKDDGVLISDLWNKINKLKGK